MQQSLQADYLRDGFVLVRSVFDSVGVAKLAAACDRLKRLPGAQGSESLQTHTRQTISGEQVIDRVDPVADLDPCFVAYLESPVLLQLLEHLIGEPVHRFKDKLIWKNPGVSGYELHQDYTFWNHAGVPADAMINATIAIDASTTSQGSIKLYAGHHRKHCRATAVSGGIFTAGAGVMQRELLGETRPFQPDMAPGDVLFFHALTPHESDPNLSSESRRVLMGSYSAARFGAIRNQFYRGYRASIAGVSQ